MSDVTRILAQIERGDSAASKRRLPLVCDALRKLAAAKLAHEKPGQTLPATALVHEAYLRLVDVNAEQNWNSRGHFFGSAAEVMRRILIDQARRKGSQGVGGNPQSIDLTGVDPEIQGPQCELLALDEALEKLATASTAGAASRRSPVPPRLCYRASTESQAQVHTNVSLAVRKSLTAHAGAIPPDRDGTLSWLVKIN